MTERECEHCEGPMGYKNRHARFCSNRCRVAAHRAHKEAQKRLESTPIPPELRDLDRWVRWGKRKRKGGTTKAPLTIAGRAASSTDAATWSSYAEAEASTVGDGLGFVLNGDGLACVDLDGVLDGDRLDPRAESFLATLDAFYVEVSPSGNGIHAWLRGGSPTGRKVYKLPDGLGVEWYADGRYITVTGKVFE